MFYCSNITRNSLWNGEVLYCTILFNCTLNNIQSFMSFKNTDGIIMGWEYKVRHAPKSQMDQIKISHYTKNKSVQLTSHRKPVYSTSHSMTLLICKIIKRNYIYIWERMNNMNVMDPQKQKRQVKQSLWQFQRNYYFKP